MKILFSKTVTYRIVLLSFILSLNITAYAQEWKQMGDNIIGEVDLGFFGFSVSLNDDGHILAVGSLYSLPGGKVQSGGVTLFQYESDTWTKLGAPIYGKDYGERIGATVSLSADGLTVAMGPNEGGSSQPKVRVYTFLAGEWMQMGAGIDGDFETNWEVNNLSLSDDGQTLAIGYPSDTGYVCIFKYISGDWVQQGIDILGETVGEIGDKFGFSVSSSADGAIIAVGATGNDANGIDAGQVSVFKYISGAWTLLGSSILGEAAGDQSGQCVKLSADGSIVAIGAPNNKDNGFDAGQIRVYQYIAGDWVQLGGDIDGADAYNWVGNNVDLSNDGSIVSFGAGANDFNGENAGLIRAYQLVSDEWVLLGNDLFGEPGERLGSFFAMSGDGNVVVEGSPLFITEFGQARVFELDTLSSTEDADVGIFSLFPNPVIDQLFITTINESSYDLAVLSAEGKLVYTEKAIKTSHKEIETQNWPQGIYFVLIQSNNKLSVKTVNVEH